MRHAWPRVHCEYLHLIHLDRMSHITSLDLSAEALNKLLPTLRFQKTQRNVLRGYTDSGYSRKTTMNVVMFLVIQNRYNQITSF